LCLNVKDADLNYLHFMQYIPGLYCHLYRKMQLDLLVKVAHLRSTSVLHHRQGPLYITLFPSPSPHTYLGTMVIQQDISGPNDLHNPRTKLHLLLSIYW